jgi:hypothetical protein
MRIQKRWVVGWIVLLGAFVASCGKAQAPMLVASYPLSSSEGNSSRGIMDGPLVIETVYLTLEVNDPDGAAETAARLADGYGGYEADRYAWDGEDGRTVAQEVFVPIDQSDNLHTRLLQMGRKNRESVVRQSDAWYGPGYGWAQFSIQYLPSRHAAEWDHSFEEDLLSSICRFFVEAATVLKQLLASLLLAAAVVISCVMMIVGAVTTIRWLVRR